MLSIVIPAYNEERYIGRCLHSIARLKVSEPLEVIVVDNASTDRTAEIALRYKGKLNLRVLRETKRGRGAARERGFRAARGRIIFSTDADCELPANWLNKLLHEIHSKRFVGVTGTLRIGRKRTVINRIATESFLITACIYRLLTGHWILSGFSSAVVADIYRKAGGFNPTMDANEDMNLSQRIARLGNIGFVGSCTVTASDRRFKHGLLRVGVEYGKCVLETEILKRKLSQLSNAR